MIERGVAHAIGRVDVGAARDKQLDRVGIAAKCRDVKGGGAEAVASVDGHAAVEEQADRLPADPTLATAVWRSVPCPRASRARSPGATARPRRCGRCPARDRRRDVVRVSEAPALRSRSTHAGFTEIHRVPQGGGAVAITTVERAAPHDGFEGGLVPMREEVSGEEVHGGGLYQPRVTRTAQSPANAVISTARARCASAHGPRRSTFTCDGTMRIPGQLVLFWSATLVMRVAGAPPTRSVNIAVR